MTEPTNSAHPTTELLHWQETLLKRSVRRLAKLSHVKRMAGNLGGFRCLEISAGDGLLSTQFYGMGASWETLAVSREAACSVALTTGRSVPALENATIPFEDETFDLVVILDALKAIDDDYGFIRECHRVLKNNGRVIIDERCKRPFSAAFLLNRIFGIAPTKRGARRDGYSDKELYNILKDGFDVPEIAHYSNGLYEAGAAFWDALQYAETGAPYWMVSDANKARFENYRRLARIAGILRPIALLCSKFEFLPGHRTAVKSRKRPWRPRVQPLLIDGRTIADAAINSKIGTAAEF